MYKTIIAAKSDNNVIGKNQKLPWHMPADLAFFKHQIQSGYLLTGRTSYEAPEGPEIFEHRQDVILVTRRLDYAPPGVFVTHSIEAAFDLAKQLKVERLNILGGAEIYAQTIHLADELIITEVHAVFDGDAFFPVIDPLIWKEVKRENYPADASNPFPYSFVWFQRC